MPIAEVQLPDGRIAELEVPQGATEDQIMEFAQQQFSQGATSAPPFQGSAGGAPPGDPAPDLQTRAARELPELFQSGILQGEDPAKVAQFSAIAAVTPDERELAQIATALFPNIGVQEDEAGNILLGNNRNQVRTIINRPGPSGTDLAQLAGIGTAFNPAARAGATGVGLTRQGLKQVAKSTAAAGGTQAGIEGAQAASGGEFNAADVGLAAGIQPTASAVSERLLSPGVRLARNQVPEDAAQVIQAGRQQGVDVMTTDVVPPKGWIGGALRQYAERIPLLGTGGRSLPGAPGRLSKQESRERAILNLYESTPEVTDEQIVSELVKSTKTQKRRAGQAIQKIDEQMNREAADTGGVPIDNTLNKIDELIEEFTRPGTPRDNPAVSVLAEMRQALTEVPQDFTLLRKNRRWINEKINQIDLAGQSQMASNSKRLMGQLSGAINKDMREFVKNRGGAARVQDFVRADRAYEDIAKDMTKTRLKNVLGKGEFTPESVETLIFSSKPSEQRLLFRNLTPKGRENVKQALIHRAIDKAGGPDDMTPNRLQTQLKKVMEGLEVFGKPEDVKQLKGLERLLQATRRDQDFSAITPTGQSLSVPQSLNNMTTGGVINALIGAPIAVAARAYESLPVRSLMVRLAGTPRGSEAEQRVLRQIVPVLTSSIQAASQVAPEQEAATQVTTESTAATPQGS